MPEAKRPGALRKLLPKVPPSQRMRFLLQLVEQFENPVSKDFEEFIVESFEASLDDADTSQPWIFYPFMNLSNADVNLPLRLKLVDAPIQKGMDSELPVVAKAIILQKMDREDEALELALETYGRIATKEASGPNTYYVNMARQNLQNAFIPDHLDAFLAVLDKEKEKGADDSGS